MGKGRIDLVCAVRCGDIFVFRGGRHAGAVVVGTLRTLWFGGRGVLCDAGGCSVVGERGYMGQYFCFLKLFGKRVFFIFIFLFLFFIIY